MKKIFKAIPALVVALTMVACSEGYQYTPADPEPSKTFVSADLTAPRNLEVDGSNILVPFVRTSADGDLTVNLYLDDPSGLFSLVHSLAVRLLQMLK